MADIVIIPEVQIDFEVLHDAKTMENYAKVELKLNTCVSENPIVLSIFDVPEADLNKIRRRCAIENYSKGTVKVINSIRDTVVGAADFASYRVVAPIAQAGIAAGTGVAKVLVKSAIATGATVIGSTLENARRTTQELKTDPEMLHAKAELNTAFNTIKGLFGFTSSDSNNNIRVIK